MSVIECMQRSAFCVPSATHQPCECELPLGHEGSHRSGRLYWNYPELYKDRIKHPKASNTTEES